MASLVCADASLALKLVLHEPDSEPARALWDEWKTATTTVVAPTLWAYEVTSVIRNRVHRGQLAPEMEAEAIATVYQLPVQLMRPAGLHQRAWELARQFDRPAAYDAHYLALAEMVSCPFWTADERLFNHAISTKSYPDAFSGGLRAASSAAAEAAAGAPAPGPPQ